MPFLPLVRHVAVQKQPDSWDNIKPTALPGVILQLEMQLMLPKS